MSELHPKVLVVDDNPDTAASLAGLLILLGFRARSFTDGPSALAAAPEFDPDVCVLDLRMPGMNGFELAARLREVLGDRAGLVALSGERGDGLGERLKAAGFQAWFTKPGDPAALVRVLHDMAGTR